MSKTKNCPFCQKEIVHDANRCKYCGNFLVGLKKQAQSEVTYRQDFESIIDALLKVGTDYVQKYVDNDLSNPENAFYGIDRKRLFDERLIMWLWLLDEFVSDPEGKLMKVVHERAFKLGSFECLKENSQTEEMVLKKILTRYEEYHKAWSDGVVEFCLPGGLQALCFITAKNIVGQEGINEMKGAFQLEVEFTLLIIAVKKFKEKMAGNIGKYLSYI